MEIVMAEKIPTPKMELVDNDMTVNFDHDITVLPDGDHKIPMSIGDNKFEVPVKVDRSLDKIKISYQHDEHHYTYVLHSDGRSYSHVRFMGNEAESPHEWERKGMWRYF